MIDRLLQVIASRWFRLVLVALIVLSFQTTLFSEIRPFGYVVPLMSLFVACAGSTHDMQTGAVVGLIAGLMYDSVLATPLGISALVFAGVGTLSALFVQPFRDPTWWMRWLSASVATALGEILTPVVKSVVGFGGWLNGRALVAALVAFVGALVFTLPLMPVARWTLRERVGRDA
jgi:rod shape-determining protein MreD